MKEILNLLVKFLNIIVTPYDKIRNSKHIYVIVQINFLFLHTFTHMYYDFSFLLRTYHMINGIQDKTKNSVNSNNSGEKKKRKKKSQTMKNLGFLYLT